MAQGFDRPPASARMWTWGFWLANNVNAETITRDLKELKAKGIGGVTVYSIAGPGITGRGGPAFLTEEWRALFAHTVREAGGICCPKIMSLDRLQNLCRCDVPMGEFWQDGAYVEDGQKKNGKQTSSAAHIYGKRIAAAEAFTSFLHRKDSPASLKPTADRAFCGGFNQFFIFSTATRPGDGRLNGKNLGVVWTAPWRVEVTGALKPADNRLEIDVVNLWPNRLIGDAGQSKEERLTQTNIKTYRAASPLLPSGLLGPVTLRAVKPR